jgi:5S rRNA maturation endonuclease (ribonuclease M5)
MTAEEYIALREQHGAQVRRVQDGWMVTCPAHDDRTPSLHVTPKEDRFVVWCHGCEQEAEVVAAVDGLTLSDFFYERRNGNREIAAEYDYTDERGELLFQVVRFAPKDFRQRRPDGAGDWTWKLDGTRRVLYRLPKVLEAVKDGRTVWIVEGEKDVHALERAGAVATTSPGGAGKWRDEFAEYLRGAKVAVIADRDEQGRAHARAVAASLEGVAATVKVGEPAEGKDATDHLRAGKGLGEFAELAQDRKPAPSGKVRWLDVGAMVREEPPAVPWVAEGIVAKGMLTALAGRHGEGKSLLAMGLTGGVSEGHTVAGLACHEGTVCYLDAENGRWEIHRRVRNLELPAEGVALAEVAGFDLRHDLDSLERVLTERKPDLLVLDSFRSLWRGEENDAGQVAACLDPLRDLIREHGAGALLLHHSGKGGGDYRGSSAIGACVDLGFVLDRITDDEQRDRRRLHCWKSRPAAEPEDRWLALHVERGRVYIEPAEPPVESAAKPEAPARAALRPQVLGLVMAEPRSTADVCRALGRHKSDGTVKRTLKALHGEGLISVHEGTPGEAHTWWVTEDGKAELEGVATPDPPKGSGYVATPLPKPRKLA